MNFEWISMVLNADFWIVFFRQFSFFAPGVGLLFAMSEAFLPMLPLSAIVTINVVALGFWQGYVASWLGSTIGTFLVFNLVRKFGMKFVKRWMEKSRKIHNLFHWIHRQGVFPIFIMLTFPFTPSIIICGLSAMAGIKSRTFLYALIFGKLFMVLSLSLIGYNLLAFIQQPIKSGVFIGAMLLISFAGKAILKRHEKKLDRLHGRKMIEVPVRAAS